MTDKERALVKAFSAKIEALKKDINDAYAELADEVSEGFTLFMEHMSNEQDFIGAKKMDKARPKKRKIFGDD